MKHRNAIAEAKRACSRCSRINSILYATQDAQVTSALTRCLADISLFKALGGNWQEVALPDVVADR